MYDAAIIGAGPAGTAAAFSLLSRGLSVLLLENPRGPGKKACAGGLTPKARHLYPFDISSVIQRTCHRVKVRQPSGKSFVISNRQPLCYMVRRKDLDLLALTRVLEKGAEFIRVKGISAIEEQSTHVGVRTQEGHFKARYLIGADGANSLVRSLTRPDFQPEKYPAIEADLYLPDCRDHLMEFDFSMGVAGYYWIFPKSDHLNIGIFAARPGQGLCRQKLKDFSRKRFGTDQLVSVRGYPIGGGGQRLKPFSGRILLAGDAAGLAEGLLGEGIYQALKSGQAAGRAIADAIQKGGDAGRIYGQAIKPIQRDLRLFHMAARLMVRYPGPALQFLKVPFVHGYFARGYGQGKTLSQLFFMG